MNHRIMDIINFKNKLIIAGTRYFQNHTMMDSFTKEFIESNNLHQFNTQLVSGGGRGADELGEEFAIRNGFKLKKFLPDWSQGKKAGPLRNKQMAEYATHLICFWDGESPGSKSMIQLARRYGLKYRVVDYKRNRIVEENAGLLFRK
ncbi:SLOG family protein [Flammeovirga agarivorans]|uniref:DUF2493 domain-containing protein n=1 Tax=Flammeovirga agarivorans TaxID=2726742 RepID=A0A7X8XYA8_9BACT|nr:SLOG family protein [Flammeovirga agarivorans]NLR94039.1 DUF2493 domain-containing protein [Flammeovirga agarivorans]